jgi:hypothetical protein
MHARLSSYSVSFDMEMDMDITSSEAYVAIPSSEAHAGATIQLLARHETSFLPLTAKGVER